MREIALDTETTGLDPLAGHRIIEIGCVEMHNHVATGESFHCYLNPERPVPAEAFAVHGLSDAFLADKPRFAEVAEKMLAFLGDARLVIHNAAFDLGFLNAELARLKRPPLAADLAIDTVRLAREKFPGSPANLDALCRRFDIDNSDRTLHGALKDAQLLARVYLQLCGGREPTLTLVSSRTVTRKAPPPPRTPRLIEPTAEEAAAHAAMLDKLKKPLWLELGPDDEPAPASS
jgi:DNA polymerase III, epsilon subunit, Proteobacterial